MSLSQQIATELEASMAAFGNVTPLRPAAKPAPALPAAANVDAIVAMHQNAVATFTGRAAEARKAGRARVAELNAQRRAEEERHRARLAAIAAEIATVKAETAATIETNEKVAESSRLALGGLS